MAEMLMEENDPSQGTNLEMEVSINKISIKLKGPK
jgi:hypothetical protein